MKISPEYKNSLRKTLKGSKDFFFEMLFKKILQTLKINKGFSFGAMFVILAGGVFVFCRFCIAFYADMSFPHADEQAILEEISPDGVVKLNAYYGMFIVPLDCFGSLGSRFSFILNDAVKDLIREAQRDYVEYSFSKAGVTIWYPTENGMVSLNAQIKKTLRSEKRMDVPAVELKFPFEKNSKNKDYER
jgi:hypothetical protein